MRGVPTAFLDFERSALGVRRDVAAWKARTCPRTPKLDASFSLQVDLARDLRQNRGSLMSDHDLRPRIKEMLVKNLMLQVTPEQIGDDLPLFGPDGLGLDSIDALELVVSMEKTFGVGVPSSEVAGKALQTVNTIHDYILEKRSAAA